MPGMRRRDFVTLLGGATLLLAAKARRARAQQPAMPVIGFLNGQSAQAFAPVVASFRRGLNEAGYVEGQNVAIEYRWAEGRLDRLPPLAADLVRRQVAVIAATGGNNSALVAKTTTSTIPIVFTSSDNPVERGLVASINRPGGNVTGVSWFDAELGPKRLGLLHELVPNVTIVALLINPNNPESVRQPAELQEAVRAIGLQLVVLTATNAGDIEAAFMAMVQNRVGALLVGSDPFFVNLREQIVALAAQHAIPTLAGREVAGANGLMSYGSSLADAYRRAGIHTARILKGAKPSDLPVDQATKFELIINLKTAKALGLDVPPALARPRRRGDRMRRREFITLLGGAAAAWPVAARAQQPAMPVIGFLDSRSLDAISERLRAFRQGLKENGYIEGENVAIEYRFAENQNDRLPELAADLVRRQVAVIATFGGVATFAAKAATTTIPIVFNTGDDPVRQGLVASLARPGGNLTGINFFSTELAAKRLELLRELVPAATRVAVLINPTFPDAEPTVRDVTAAAHVMGLQIEVHNATTSREINAAFATFVHDRPDALFVGADPFLTTRRVQLVHLASFHSAPRNIFVA